MRRVWICIEDSESNFSRKTWCTLDELNNATKITPALYDMLNKLNEEANKELNENYMLEMPLTKLKF